MISEVIGQAVSDAITSAIGTHVELGVVASCDPADMLATRPLPVRAIVVRFQRPLRDVMVFVTSLKEEVVRPLVEVAATAALSALDITPGDDHHGTVGAFSIATAVEYTTLDVALEQCDGLYLEASYSMDMPTGELQMILGTGLLESANCFLNAVADPFAEEPPCLLPGQEVSDLELGDMIADIGGRPNIELGATIDAPPAGPGIGFAPAPAGPVAPAAAQIAAGGGLDALDALLAQQESAEQAAMIPGESSVPSAQALAATASANAAAATEQSTARWTQLLSGVEVELSAELGRADLTLGDITSLITDSVLTLDQMIHEPVGVFVNGTRYATARLVVVDGEYGIEILEVVDQSHLLAAIAA